MASSYDEAFTNTAIGRTLRDLVWMHMDAMFAASRCVLELGCGTGTDAIRLARQGTFVVATDASGEMIHIARAKAREAGCAERIEFRCEPMERVPASLAGRTFDGVLSNFGAVNCVSSLRPLIDGVAGLLAPGAPLLFVIMGRYVPWEWLWYLARGDWRRAFRRLARDGVEWRGLTISYPTPAETAESLRRHFSIDNVIPLGFALPPTYAARTLERSPRLLRGLTRLELRAQRASALAGWADHYLVRARRLQAGAAA